MGDDDTHGDRVKHLLKKNIRWIIAATIALAATGLAVVILFRDSRQLLTAEFSLNPLLLLLSFAVEIAGLFVAVFVWGKMLTRHGIKQEYWRDFRIYSYSMIGVVLPGRIWAAAGRVALYSRQKYDSLPIATASVAEFMFLGLAGVLVFGLSSLVQPASYVWLEPGIAVAIIALSIVLVQPPIYNRLTDLFYRLTRQDRLKSVTLTYPDMISWLILESVVIFVGGVAVYILFLSLFPPTPESLFWPIISAWAIANISGNLFFWLPGTPIIRDGVMALILAQWLPPSVAILFVLVVRVWTLASILALIFIVGLIFERDSGRNLLRNNPFDPRNRLK